MAQKRRKGRHHEHGEAFALMRYDCRACSNSEITWNSRDGVTPFVMHCPECGGDMVHVDWGSDIYAPDHIPEPGQGVWIDLPDSLKPAVARARIEAYKDQVARIIDEEDRQVLLKALIKDMIPGTPWLIWWPESVWGDHYARQVAGSDGLMA